MASLPVSMPGFLCPPSFQMRSFLVEAVNDRQVDHPNSERRITKYGFASALASPPADNLR